MRWAPEPVASGYEGARDRFRAACARRGVTPTAHVHPLSGPDGEILSADVVLIGAPDAERLLVVISGTHGAEALAGSSCQVSWLASPAFDPPAGVAVLMIHMINPWGAAWGRRQTEGNVDLNRNFLDFSAALPINTAYDRLKPAFDYPSHDPVGGAKWAECGEAGANALVAAVFQGQYADPAGVGYGGNGPTWSNRTLRDILAAHAAHARIVAVVDIHTGFGPYGYGMPISSSQPDSRALLLARQWYGPSLNAVRVAAANQLPYDFQGDLCSAIEAMLAPAIVVPVALEFGTFGVDELVRLQIDDCWNHAHSDRDNDAARHTRAGLNAFFHPATSDWLEMIRFRAHQIMDLAIGGMIATVPR